MTSSLRLCCIHRLVSLSVRSSSVSGTRCIKRERKRSIYSNDSRKYISTTRGNGVRGGRRGNGRGRGPIDDNLFRCPQCDHINRKPPSARSRFHICVNDKCGCLMLISEEEAPHVVIEETVEEKPPLPFPRKIHEFLDGYVIGQERAKKVVATQVYNHYKRLRYNKPTTIQQPAGTEIVPYQENGLTPASPRELIQIALALGSPLGPGTSYQQQPMESQQSMINIMDSHDDKLNLEKSNILLVGPTGSGKTLIPKTLAKCLDVPFAMWDCTNLTPAGYVGEDVEAIISQLYQDANHNVEKCSQGIVFLDEVDKIRSSKSHDRDIGGEGVQQSLLKLLEGTVLNIQVKNKKLQGQGTVSIDTSNILFILSGAFTGLEDVVKKRISKKSVGFGAETIQDMESLDPNTPHSSLSTQQKKQFTEQELMRMEQKERDNLLQQVETQDLVDYGMLPEFVGRVPIIVKFHSLQISDLIRILHEPKNSLISQKQTLLGLEECKLTFTTEALKAIAELALERKTGARGLTAIVENVLFDVMYDVPGSDISSVIITEDVVRGLSSPQYIRNSVLDCDEQSKHQIYKS